MDPEDVPHMLGSPAQKQSTSPVAAKSPLYSYDARQLSNWLREQCLLDEESAKQFEQEEIDGCGFLGTLEESHITRICPNLPIGKVLRILAKRNEQVKGGSELVATQQSPPTNYSHQMPAVIQNYRPFMKPVSADLLYTKNEVIPFLGNETESLVKPVHIFVEFTNVNIEQQFCKKAAEYVCAIVNASLNATIYYGVTLVEMGGSVEGIKVSEDPIDEAFKKLFACFDEDQREAVKSCVMPPVFVKVNSPHESDYNFVIEVDVIPSHSVCLDSVFYVCLPKQDGGFEKQAVYCWREGKSSRLDKDDLIALHKSKSFSSKLRQKAEEAPNDSKPPAFFSTCDDTLRNLLTHGENSFDGLFPVLALGRPATPELTLEYVRQNLSFIKEIPWRTVFDFDANASVYNVLNKEGDSMVHKMLDEFSSKNSQKPDEDQYAVEVKSWISVNGHISIGEAPLDPVPWKIERREHLIEAAKHLKQEIPEGRAVIVFLLLSDYFPIMLELFNEVSSNFPDQWCIICEDSNIANYFNEQVIQRNCATQENLALRTVVDMPYSFITETVHNLCGPNLKKYCRLPNSHGSCQLKQRNRNEWTHLNILSLDECDNCVNDLATSRDIEAFKKDEEQRFYRGGPVSWWNFWCGTHVLKRDIHIAIMQQVKDALAGKYIGMSEDDGVAVIHLKHEPGAGATTTAMHILWDLRREYRCSVVKFIVEQQTSRQILQFRCYEEEDSDANAIRPVLILLDNEDDEKVSALRSELQEMVKQRRRGPDRPNRTFFVFLICARNSKIADNEVDVLRHRLSKKELKWFREKYENWEKKHLEKGVPDPKLLISFNILKENFSQDSVKRMTTEFLSKIYDSKEMQLLKYIAMLNTFDIKFRPIPVTSFDDFMPKSTTRPAAGYRCIFGIYAPSRRDAGKNLQQLQPCWESKITEPLRNLLNEPPDRFSEHHKCFRIINGILSKEIFGIIISGELRQQCIIQTTSEVMLEFLDCESIFKPFDHRSNRGLQEIVRGILRQRARDPTTGKPASTFPPLIQNVIECETPDKAADVLIRGFEVFKDPFIAQQLARLYIKRENWIAAEKYARKALELVDKCSHLQDTLCQVYKEKLIKDHLKRVYMDSSQELSRDQIIETIKLGIDAIHSFRKEQEVSELERSTSYHNDAGYFGEIHIVIKLLDCLRFCSVFKGKPPSEMHRFLVDSTYCPEEFEYLKDVGGRNLLCEVKALHINVQLPIRILKDYSMQLKDSAIDDYTVNQRRLNYEKLHNYIELLDKYFGEDSDEPPNDYTGEEKCKFRLRRIQWLGGDSTKSLFDCKIEGPQGCIKIKHIISLMKENVQSPYASAEDYMVLIGAHLTLSLAFQAQSEVQLADLVEWSLRLYEERNKIRGTHVYLEPFLFYTMFNWPRECFATQCSIKDVIECIAKWRKAYFVKYPFQSEGKVKLQYRMTSTTMFFLGKDMHSYGLTYSGTVFEDQRHVSDGEFWNGSAVRQNLQQFQGNLINKGTDIRVRTEINSNVDHSLIIPSGVPINEPQWWNKTVYFYIGFSWSGPKAFGLKREPDKQFKHLVASPRPMKTKVPTTPPAMGSKPPKTLTVNYVDEIQKIDEKLQKIEKIKQKKSHKRNESEIEAVQEELSLRERRKELRKKANENEF